ncbi:hypothetical protein BHQ19_09340 [Mycolicibacterium porcinum]|nr:hypothetical protein BHQ19_09340 [Mycolicibacterium porcinum]
MRAAFDERRAARSRAVGQERPLGVDQAQDQAADGQAGEAQRTETADDRDVEQQVDGFGRQDPQRRQRQAGDATGGGRRDRDVAFRLNHGYASASASA